MLIDAPNLPHALVWLASRMHGGLKRASMPGMQARAAAIVMRSTRNTVNTGRTVVCTIHQPSIDIFEVTYNRLFALFAIGWSSFRPDQGFLSANASCATFALEQLKASWVDLARVVQSNKL